jgi:SAM-dependent methyltransferase
MRRTTRSRASALQKQFAWWITRATWMVFDSLHGVDTGAVADERELEISSENRGKGLPYDPTPWKALPQVLRLASLPVAGFSFVDVGCGKGKMLLSALRYPFARVVGVEFSRYLCQVAERNLTAARLVRRQCANVQVHCVDAVEYPIPEGPVIFFFGNPFTYEVMERVLDNIVSSHLASRRPMYLIFYGASSYLPRIAEFLRLKSGACQRASGMIGKRKRTIYVFELPLQ